MGKRVLVTGLGTFWGGRVAQALESDPEVEVIVGLDRTEPEVALERTEYVRADESYSILSRIVRAARIDTVVHTFLVVDSGRTPDRALHETNVIGTMNLFAAASAPGSTVRQVLVKSSTLVYGSAAGDPAWFTEETRRTSHRRHPVERSLVEVEGYVRDFVVDSPHVAVSVLRFSNVLGPTISTSLSRLLELPLVPAVLGFDPLVQFVHEDDVIRAVLHALRAEVQGVYNVAGDGRLPWSEVVHMCGRRTLPLTPFGTGLVTRPLSRLRLLDLPPELLDLLRHGRGVDNTRFKRAGFDYRHTSTGAVAAYVEALRRRRATGDEASAPHDRHEVEQFLRRSPAVAHEASGGRS